jgi:hypothetical protein
MKKLFLLAILATLTLLSMPAIAVDCDLLAVQVSGIADKQERNYATDLYNSQCNGGSQSYQQEPEPQQTNTVPQFVPSMNKWCQVVNGVMNCWD